MNRCTTSRVHEVTPHEKYYGNKPDLSHVRIFDSIAYIVVKISGYEEKTGRSGQVGRCNMCTYMIGNVNRKVGGGFIPHCNSVSSLGYKRREGSLVKGLPILC